MTESEWSQADLRTLIENIQAQLPKNDVQTFSTTEKRLPWEKIEFGDFSAKECQEKWIAIVAKLRRFRTMTEMVGDAIDWVEHPWQDFYKKKKNKTKNPLIPARPLGVYIRFFKEQRDVVASENPDVNNTDISKMVGVMYNAMSEKKKSKLQKQYNKEMEEYKVEAAMWKEIYPEDIEERYQENGHAPKLPSARGLFVRQKLETSHEEDIEAKRRLARESFDRYNDLKERKRLLWDEQLKELREQYQAEYSGLHPDDLPAHLRKNVQKAKKGFLSGYNLFTKDRIQELMNEGMSGPERLAEISRLWKQLPPDERDVYNEKAKIATLERETGNGEQQQPAGAGIYSDEDEEETRRPTQPVNAMFLFLEAKTKLLKEKEPELSDAEVKRLLVHAFNKLPDNKKKKYEQLAAERRQSLPTHKPKKSKPKSTTPKKLTAYNAFFKMKNQEMKSIPAAERMKQIVTMWKAMSPEEKAEYNQDDIVPEENTPTTGSKRKQATPTKVVKQAKLEEEEMSSEEEDDVKMEEENSDDSL